MRKYIQSPEAGQIFPAHVDFLYTLRLRGNPEPFSEKRIVTVSFLTLEMKRNLGMA